MIYLVKFTISTICNILEICKRTFNHELEKRLQTFNEKGGDCNTLLSL